MNRIIRKELLTPEQAADYKRACAEEEPRLKKKPVIHIMIQGRSPFPADAEDVAKGIVSYFAKGRRLIGIQTCIDESSIYCADLSSPFFYDPATEAPQG